MKQRMKMSLYLSMLLVVLTGFASAQSTSVPPPEPKFEPETFYVAIMQKTADYREESQATSRKSRHREYWQAIASSGELVLGGPVTDDRAQAVMIYRAATPEDAATYADGDPYVQSKQWKAEVHPWMTQKGVLHPIEKYEPSATYYLGFLKRGEKWSPEETPERERIQAAHLANIKRLHDAGKLVAAGPFTEDGDLRGIFVFKTASLQEALELTNTDPAVQAGRLRIELYPWQLSAGSFAGK